MATRIKDLQPRKRYPWEEWADGAARRLQRGKDYTTTDDNFRATVYARATKLGMKAITQCPKPGVVRIQFLQGD